MRLLSFVLLLAVFCFGCGPESSYKNREADQNAAPDAYEYGRDTPETAPAK